MAPRTAGLTFFDREWLIAIARVNAVELLEQRRPTAGLAVEPAPDLSGGLLHQIGREPDELGSRGHCGDLSLATLLQILHQEECVRHRRPAGQQAVVPQDQRIMLAE